MTAAGLTVTSDGSLSQPVHVASTDDYDAAVRFCNDYPPTSLALTQEMKECMLSPTAWRFRPVANMTVMDEPNQLLYFSSNFNGSIFATLPIPSLLNSKGDHCQKDIVYYFEMTVIDIQPNVALACGFSSQPYPQWRLPGWHYFSVGYHSDDGRVYANDSVNGISYGSPYRKDDTIGVGLSSTNSIFFTRNGKRLKDVVCRTPAHLSLYPVVGCDGACSVCVNFGVTPFVWKEANKDGESLPVYI